VPSAFPSRSTSPGLAQALVSTRPGCTRPVKRPGRTWARGRRRCDRPRWGSSPRGRPPLHPLVFHQEARMVATRGQPTTFSAYKGFPPIAYTSDSELGRGDAPVVAWVVDHGRQKKSTVATSPLLASSFQTSASSLVSVPTEQRLRAARGSHVRAGNLRELRRAELAGSTRAVAQQGETAPAWGWPSAARCGSTVCGVVVHDALLQF